MCYNVPSSEWLVMGTLYDGVADNPPGGNDPSDPIGVVRTTT